MKNLTTEENIELQQLLKEQKSLTVFFTKEKFNRLAEIAQKVRNGMVERPEPNEHGELSIKDWYVGIEDMVVRNYAIENAKKAKNLNQMLTSLAESIELGFDWETSEQGQDYWLEVYNNHFEE
ncbi:MAG: hypothetical protein IMY67_11190 [Bacteroidetes bacterium]|nr:hypothetical protein [Bacteroidota bacterium]